VAARPRGVKSGRTGLGRYPVLLEAHAPGGGILLFWYPRRDGQAFASLDTAREALRQNGSAPGAVSTEALAFARLHRLSGVLNGTTMLAGVLVLAAVGLRR